MSIIQSFEKKFSGGYKKPKSLVKLDFYYNRNDILFFFKVSLKYSFITKR